MQALRLVGRHLEVGPVQAVPRTAEIPITVHLAGICHTDLELSRGYMGFQGILGHEFVGRAQTGEYAGQMVVGDINCSCRICPVCCRGDFHHCPQRTVLGILGRDGAFAETLWLPAENLVPLPSGLPAKAAVFAEPLAAALRILEQVQLSGGERVAVLGDGKLGLLSALVLGRQPGLQVTLIGHHREKSVRLADRGISFFHGDDNKLAGTGFDLVVEATGRALGLAQALKMVRPQGTIIQKTTIAGALEIDLAPLVINEVSLVGSRCGPLAEAVAVLAAGEVDPIPLIDDIFPLAEGVAAFTRARAGGTIKILIEVKKL